MYNGMNINKDLSNLNLKKIYDVSKTKYMTKPDKVSSELYKNYTIDESKISNEAYQKYIKENDIKQFTSLLFSQENSYIEDIKCKSLFENSVFNNDDPILNGIINNEKFLKDVFS